MTEYEMREINIFTSKLSVASSDRDWYRGKCNG
jgi:hypothetical protein